MTGERAAWALTPPGWPALPSGWVRRERLHQKLALAIEHPATVLTGPPGAGKTVLLAGWAQYGAPGPVAWLSLGPADNDPSRFWRHLSGVLQTVDPSLAAALVPGPAAARRARPAPPGARRRREPVAVRRSASPDDPPTAAPTILIVDNLEVLTAPEAIRTTISLVRHLPAHGRLVLAGRHLAPPLLEVLGAGGRLSHMRAADLRFTPEETVDFFSSPGVTPVRGAKATALAVRTEGWAAGLRLADLMVAASDNHLAALQNVTGEARLVAEYFQREVLDRQPADRVRFLLASSVLDELTGEAAVAVTGDPHAATLLDILYRQHTLIDRSESPLVSYRYHPLFLEFLRHEVHTGSPALCRRSHVRAAAWSEAAGDDEAAVRHLVHVGRYDRAFTLGLPGVVRILDGRLLQSGGTLAITSLPEPYFDVDPWRRYVEAAARLAELRPAEAGRRIRRLRRASRDHPARTQLQGRAELLSAFRAGLLADPDGVLLHSHRAVTLLGALGPVDPDASDSDPRPGPGPGPVDPEDPPGQDLPPGPGWPQGRDLPPWLGTLDDVLRRRLPALVAAAHLWLGDAVTARAALPGRSEASDLSFDPDHLSVLAGAAYLEGRLDDASRWAEDTLATARRHDQAAAISTLEGLLTLSGVHYERDDLIGAEVLVDHALQLCQADSLGHWQTAVGCDRALLMIARGHPVPALDHLLDLRLRELEDPLPGPVRQRLDRVEIRCRLVLGDLDGAAGVLRSQPVEARPVEAVARLDLAAGRPDRAADRLATHLVPSPQPRVRIERLLLLARSYLQLGDEARAAVAVRRAVDQGRRDRFVRVFVDEGPELVGPLTAISNRSHDAYVAGLLAHVAGLSSGPAANRVEMLEPLTDRQRQLLGYLPSHLSQHEIAALMNISLNTVKTHTKAVYRKLGVTSRSAAVDRARTHGLLSHHSPFSGGYGTPTRV